MKIKNHIITTSNYPLVPVGFDCTKIRQLGIDKQENFLAGAIMIACGAAEGGSGSSVGFFQRITQAVKKLLVPLYGAGDVYLIYHPDTSPNITQSETYLRLTRITHNRSSSPSMTPEAATPALSISPAHRSPLTVAALLIALLWPTVRALQ